MRIKKMFNFLLIALLILTTFPLTISAEEEADETTETKQTTSQYKSKDEVIYGKLDASGNVNDIYVVNSFYTNEPSTIIDYGQYLSVRNLTDLTDIEMVGDNEVHFQMDDEFYYQGELESKILPWHISITYLLDGEKIDPEELAGQSGDLEIQIETKQNKAVDSVFFDYYLLQVSIMLDPLIFEDILAPKGTEANEGKNKLITFSGMPGTEDVMIVTASVDQLELEPIQIAAVPANIAIEDPDTDDLTENFKVLADAIDEINKGVGDLQSGVTDLRSGATELSKGSSAYQDGIKELSRSSSELVAGSKEILSALQMITSELAHAPEMPDLSEIEQLPGGLREIAQAIRGFSDMFEQLTAGINEIPDGTLTEEQMGAIYQVLEESEADPSLLEAVGQLDASYQVAQGIKQMTQALPEELETSMVSLPDEIEALASEIEGALGNLDQLDDLAELQTGLTTLAQQYETFHNGLVSYTNGVDSLAKSYGELNTGTKSLADGTVALETGVQKLKEGTQQLAEETSDLPDQIKTEIEKFMEEFDYSDFEPVSFVSDKNENINVVQFVLQTKSIELDEPEEAPEEEDEKRGLWESFLDLFR